MKYFCPYHKIELVESQFNKNAYVCKNCKDEKIDGRDGIFDKDELLKKSQTKSGNEEVPSDLEFTKKEIFRINQRNIIKDDDYVPNIYDDPAYDDYDGF